MRGWLGSPLALLAVAAAVLPSIAAAQGSPAPHLNAIRYDIARRVTGSIAPDPDGSGPIAFAAIRNTYDARGRLTKVETGELAAWQAETIAPANWNGFTVHRSIETLYDEMGRKLRDTVKVGSTVEQVTQYSYNAMGALDCTAVRMNPASLPSPPPHACTQAAEPGQGSFGPDHITRRIYNLGTGRLEQIRRGVGTPIEQVYVSYTHTANGQVATVTDANGGTARYAYDGHDRVRRWVMSSPTTAGVANEADYEEYGYDPSGNRLTVRKRDSAVLTFSYDALSRMVSKTIPDCAPVTTTCPLTSAQSRDIFYRYDNRNLQRAVRFDSYTGPGLVTTYDAAGRAESSTNSLVTPSWVIGYQWNRNGVRTRVTHPDGAFFTYEPDGLNRIVAIRENGVSLLADYVFNGRGELISSARGGAASSAQYDSLSRPSSVTHDLASASYDLTTGYSYSPANQIVIRTRSNDAYIYTGDVDGSRTYSVNGLNQYLTAGGTSLGYDPNGNLTSDGATTYTYDRENRLIAASGGKTASLSYDPLGRLFRVSDTVTTTTRFLYDGDELIGEYVGGVLTRRFVHGAAIDDPITAYDGTSVNASSRRQLFADHQGSIIATADSGGALITGGSPNRYDDWGAPDAANSGRFQFTGQAWIAELGLYHYKARFYSPALARFLQTDPIGYAGGLNLYNYVGGDPIAGRDPYGLARVCAARTGSLIDACVNVDADGDGNSRDNDLSAKDSRNLGRSFSSFIANNNNRDISRFGTAVFSGDNGVTSDDVNYVRATTQFVGAGLASIGLSWTGNIDSSITVRSGTEPAGSTDSGTRRGTGGFSEHFIYIDGYGHRANASSLARTILHEYGHRRDQGGFVVANNQAHQQIDALARQRLRDFGLDGGGCPSVGGIYVFGYQILAPDYPGCRR